MPLKNTKPKTLAHKTQLDSFPHTHHHNHSIHYNHPNFDPLFLHVTTL